MVLNTRIFICSCKRANACVHLPGRHSNVKEVFEITFSLKKKKQDRTNRNKIEPISPNKFFPLSFFLFGCSGWTATRGYKIICQIQMYILCVTKKKKKAYYIWVRAVERRKKSQIIINRTHEKVSDISFVINSFFSSSISINLFWSRAQAHYPTSFEWIWYDEFDSDVDTWVCEYDRTYVCVVIVISPPIYQCLMAGCEWVKYPIYIFIYIIYASAKLRI